jgi:hypothetical protein
LWWDLAQLLQQDYFLEPKEVKELKNDLEEAINTKFDCCTRKKNYGFTVRIRAPFRTLS